MIVFLCIVFLAISSFALPQTSRVPTNANWMERAIPIIGNLTLQQITLPGTHDSGSYYLTDEMIDSPEYLEEIIKVADELQLPVGDIIKGWAKSQDSDFYSQFLDGIRYVDVRLCFVDNVWKTHHGPVVGNPLEVLFQHTKQFVSQYSSEVLIMELSHADATTVAQQQILIDEIEKYLGDYLWPPSNGFKTINQMIASGKNILMSLQFTNLPDNIWANNTIINSYANSPVLSTMEAYNVGEVQQYAHHGIYANQLFKLSWTLTPNDLTILEMLIPGFPHTLIELADYSNKDLDNWYDNNFVNQSYKYPILGNILIIDHYSTSPIIEIVQRGLTLMHRIN